MDPLVIYHANCWDGFCAAWVCRRGLVRIEAKAAYYGEKPPDVTGRDVADGGVSGAAAPRVVAA